MVLTSGGRLSRKRCSLTCAMKIKASTADLLRVGRDSRIASTAALSALDVIGGGGGGLWHDSASDAAPWGLGPAMLPPGCGAALSPAAPCCACGTAAIGATGGGGNTPIPA